MFSPSEIVEIVKVGVESATHIGAADDHRRRGVPPPPWTQISHKKLNLQKEKLIWAVVGVQIFGFQTPPTSPPPPSPFSLQIHPWGGVSTYWAPP